MKGFWRGGWRMGEHGISDPIELLYLEPPHYSLPMVAAVPPCRSLSKLKRRRQPVRLHRWTMTWWWMCDQWRVSGFRANVPPGLIGSRQPRPQHSDCVGELREVSVCCCGRTGLWLSDRWGQHCCKIRRGLLEHFWTFLLYSFSERHCSQLMFDVIFCSTVIFWQSQEFWQKDNFTVTKVKPAAMARWLRAKPGSWILLSICRPQGGTKKLAA